MLSRLIRRVLFTLIHLIVSLIVTVKNVYLSLWVNKCSTLSEEITEADVKMIRECMPKIKKRLKHIVIMTDVTQHCMSDMARIVIWSLIAGIPYISFYDIRGHFSKFEEKLFLEVEQKKKGIPGCIRWANRPELNGYTNGSYPNIVKVNILKCNDGRNLLVQCVRDLAEGKIQNSAESTQFTVKEMDNALSYVYKNIVDPDLILYTGPLCCTHGILPWHIRLTEFIQLSIDHRINIKKYVGALHQYSNCDQRFGK